MAKPRQQHYWNIAIPWEIFMELSDYMSDTRTRESMGDLAGKAIHNWIDEQRSIQNGLRTPTTSMLSGYQWKRLFLPDGTMARASCKGVARIAQVANNKLVFEGVPITPHEFANATGASPRNAWKVIWLLFPGEREWKLADDCRPSRAVRSAARSAIT